MRYTQEELVKKIKEEIISLYEGLIGAIFKELTARAGKEKAERLFDEVAGEIDCPALDRTPENKISLQGLREMEKDRIVSCCNGFISSLIVRIGEQGRGE